jgi:hypothetical protein
VLFKTERAAPRLAILTRLPAVPQARSALKYAPEPEALARVLAAPV